MLLLAGGGQAATVNWISSRAEAMAQASAQGKLVYLLGGRTGCGICADVKQRAVNATNPPLNQMMEECFVGWYSNLDLSREQDPYEVGLEGYSLPLMCWIDPKAPLGTYLDRRTGQLDDTIMLMLMRKALRKAPLHALNLTNTQVVTDPDYVVRGSLFTNLLADRFYYRVNGGAWTEALTEGPVSWKTNWAASLTGQPLLPNTHSNTLQAYALFTDGSRSRTNTWTFAYLPRPPLLVSGPVSVATLTGSTAAFAVTASNASGYVWYREGQAAPLSTGPSLQFNALTPDQAGRYYCAVSNAAAGLITPAASLVVFEPRLYPPQCPGLRIFAPAGQGISLLQRSDCEAGGWRIVTNLTVTARPLDLVDTEANGQCASFYRLGLTDGPP